MTFEIVYVTFEIVPRQFKCQSYVATYQSLILLAKILSGQTAASVSTETLSMIIYHIIILTYDSIFSAVSEVSAVSPL